MTSFDTVNSKLLFYMEEALKTCVILLNHTEKNFCTFSSNDDGKIIETINEREQIINILINLENKVDVILDENINFAFGENLPADIDDIRKTIRSVLFTVSNRDLEAMNLISSKMQYYRDETIKARNRKHLSAYIRSGVSLAAGNSYDLKK